ncbi:hypothetical protein [Janthinobacterium sp. LB3P118]|uniref:hypothetical protein n=1 Tax=Janthinobacterium sp. LB3P118 TaxID=3424195 RepID=UPI003F1F913D
MPKTKSSSAFLTSLIQNEQVTILSSRVLFLLHIDTLAHQQGSQACQLLVQTERYGSNIVADNYRQHDSIMWMTSSAATCR